MVKFVSKGKVEIFKTFDEIPYEVIGHESDLSELRERGYCVHRAELDIFKEEAKSQVKEINTVDGV